MKKAPRSFPRVRWKVKAPPRAWVVSAYSEAKKRRDVKDPVAFVRWLWEKYLKPAERRALRAKPNPFVSDGMVETAASKYEEFSGKVANKSKWVNIPKPPRVVVTLGVLEQINYLAEKEGDPGKTEYYHRFKNPKPLLVCDPKTGKLFIAGGRYKITGRGIVG